MFGDTDQLNDYLESRGANRLPVVTGKVLEDLLHLLYSMDTESEGWGKLWSYLAEYFDIQDDVGVGSETERLVLDYLINKQSIKSRFVGEILEHTYDTQGPYYLTACLSEAEHTMKSSLKDAVIGKGLGAALLFILHDPKYIEVESSMAAHDPDRLWWLVHNGCKKPWYSETDDMSTIVELGCLTLIKCFETSSTEVESKSRFKKLLRAYVLATRWREDGEYTDIDCVVRLVGHIRECYHTFGENIPDSYRQDYAKALIFALDVNGVTMPQLIDLYPGSAAQLWTGLTLYGWLFR